MKIIVCAKQVPDMNGKISVKPDGTLDRSAMSAVTNPADLCAVEAALALKEQLPDVSVAAISMGPPQAWSMLHELLAMGCDEAVLVSGREFGGSDTYATSQILAAAIRTIGFGSGDLILCGEKSIDGETGQVGAQLAEWLDIPHVLRAAEIHAGEGGLYVKRRVEGGAAVVRASLPCLVSCTDKLNRPRYLKVRDILSFDAKPCRTLGYAELKDCPPVEPDMIGLKGSPTTVFQPYSPAKRSAVQMLDGPAQESVERLFSVLKEQLL